MEYWTTRLGSEFSIDIYLDTNILEYLVSNKYPSLTKLFDELVLYPEFITLKTTNYVVFEFCEVRKRYYFSNLAIYNGEDLNEKKIRAFDSDTLNFEEECVPVFLHNIKRDRDKIIYDYNLEISKDFHSNLWERTLDISLRTRLSREDCFVIASSLMPDESSIPQLISLITNDKHLSDSIYDSSLLSIYLNDNNLIHPIVWHIRCNDNTVKCFGERNLTENHEDNFISEYCKEIVLKLLLHKQKGNFIGKTFKVAPQLNDVIGVRVDENSGINISIENRIVIVSKNLDYILLSPRPIESFIDRNRNQIALPFSVNEVDAFTFQFPSFDEETIQGKFQIEIFSRLKEGNDFVFLLPN
jgi:hypothetical protein